MASRLPVHSHLHFPYSHSLHYMPSINIILSIRDFQVISVWADAAVTVSDYKMTPTTSMHLYAPRLPAICRAEWWLNNMHYPCHQPQGSIFCTASGQAGSPRALMVCYFLLTLKIADPLFIDKLVDCTVGRERKD